MTRKSFRKKLRLIIGSGQVQLAASKAIFIHKRLYSYPRKVSFIISNSRTMKVASKHSRLKFYSWVEDGKLSRLPKNRDRDIDELLKIINSQNEKK